MKYNQTTIDGAYEVYSLPNSDERGSLERLFCERELWQILCDKYIKQINYSKTALKGTIRGLHYQKSPHLEAKLIRCVQGEVWDVMVDLRKNSKTWLHWYATKLGPELNKSIFIPEGCAHGFQALTDNVEMLYCHTANYEPASEGGIAYNDPAIGVDWPVEITYISARDKSHPFVGEGFNGVDP